MTVNEIWLLFVYREIKNAAKTSGTLLAQPITLPSTTIERAPLYMVPEAQEERLARKTRSSVICQSWRAPAKSGPC